MLKLTKNYENESNKYKSELIEINSKLNQSESILNEEHASFFSNCYCFLHFSLAILLTNIFKKIIWNIKYLSGWFQVCWKVFEDLERRLVDCTDSLCDYYCWFYWLLHSSQASYHCQRSQKIHCRAEKYR